MAKDAIQNFINSVNSDISGLIAVAVVDLDSAMALGTHSNSAQFNPELAAAYNTEVVKSKLKAIEALNLNQGIDDVLISLEKEYHLISVTKDARYMAYIAADKGKANLAMARAIIKKNMIALEKALK